MIKIDRWLFSSIRAQNRLDGKSWRTAITTSILHLIREGERRQENLDFKWPSSSSCDIYRKRKLRENAFNFHSYAHACLSSFIRSLVFSVFFIFFHRFFIPHFYSLFLREQRITVLGDKAMVASLALCILEPAIILVFLLLDNFWYCFFNIAHWLLEQPWLFYFFDQAQWQSAYSCFIYNSVLKRI